MTNSPESLTQTAIDAVYEAKNCAARLTGCHIDLLDSCPFVPPRNGAVEWRFEQHTSRDGTCIVQYDIYVSVDGREVKIIYTLEVDFREYIALYDRPQTLFDEV